jgi:hypothetical protein
MKKFLIILGIVVVVIAGGLAILVANLDKVVNSKKDYFLGKAETAIGREVAVGDIGVTLSRGIGVKLSNVSVADDPSFSRDKFVAAENLTVRVKFWPLLKKQIEVKRLVLNEPVINVIRNKNGVFNFASIVQEQSAAAQTGTVESAPGAAESAAAASVVLAFADIKNGTIRFEDHQGGRNFEIAQIDFTAENAGLGEVASIKLAAAVAAEEQNVRLEGTVGPVESVEAPEDLKPTPVDLKVSLGPLMIDNFRKYLPDEMKPYRLGYLELGEVRASLGITGTLGALELSESEITAEVLGAGEPNVTLRATAGPIDVMPTPEQSPPAVFVTADVELGPLPLEKVREKAGSAGVAPPELSMAGVATAAARISGYPDMMSFDAEVDLDLTGGSMTFGEKFNKPAGTPFKANSKVSLSKTSADIEHCTITLADLLIDAEGKADLTGEIPSLDLAIHSNEVDIAAFADMLPALKQFAVGGAVKLLASVVGAMSPGKLPKIDGTVELKNGSATLEQMPQPVSDAEAKIAFTDRSARIESASLQVGRSPVRVGGRATSLQPLKASYAITSSEAYRTDFQTPPQPSPRPEVLRDVRIEGNIWQEGETIHHRGTASSANGSLANVDYRDLNATLVSTQDKVDIEKFSARAMGGTVTGKGTFYPKQKPPRFEVTTSIRKVNLAEYFTYKVKSLPKFIDGTIDLDLDLGGAGKGWAEIQPTLTGKGGAVVIQGALLNINIANELLTGLAQVPLVDPNMINNVRNKNPKLFSGQNTAFKDFKATVRIDNGRIHSKGMVLRTADFSIFGDGWVSFDRRLDLKTDIVFSAGATQNIVRELKVAKYLTNDKGQLVIPVTLSGLITKPTVVPDVDALSKKLQASALDAGVDQLKDQVEDQVKDFLKGFGKKKSEAKKDTTKNN